MKSRERTKLIIVVGLAVVFVLVGYFRFLHGKIKFFNKPEGGVEIPAAVEVPTVDLKGLMEAAKTPKMAPDVRRARLRDIFVPVKAPPTGIHPAADAAVPLKPLPTLLLKGTIVGGARPLAIINGQFLHKGERIAGLEVVSITKEQVTLAGEGKQVVLNTLTGAEERSP